MTLVSVAASVGFQPVQFTDHPPEPTGLDLAMEQGYYDAEISDGAASGKRKDVIQPGGSWPRRDTDNNSLRTDTICD